MKVLLIKDVSGLGKSGDIKDVKDGYGNNFLVKNGHAKLATDVIIKQHASKLKKDKENLELEIIELKKLSKILENTTVKITKKMGENGSIFGSITKDEVSSALFNEANITIDKKLINFKHTIKSIGIFLVEVKFHHSITAEFKIDVIGE